MKKYHKVVAYILMLCLMWGTTLGHAQSATWEELSKTRQGSISLYTANQHSSHGLQQGIAKIRPTAQHIAKAMVKVGAVMAVEIAIEQLLGAVDYVMDPANNQIRYKPFADDQKIIQGQGRCSHGIYDVITNKTTEYRGTFAQMQQLACASHKGNPYHTVSWYVDAPSPLHYKYFHFVCDGGHGANVGIICEVKGLEQQLSFEAIAEQILKNADSGQAEAIQFVGQVADELATQQEKEKQWEATKHIIANTNANESVGSDADVSNPTKDKDDSDKDKQKCQPELKDLEEQLSEVKSRYCDLLIDRHGLYPTYKSIRNPHPKGHGSWDGHIKKYNDERKILRVRMAGLFMKNGGQCLQYTPKDTATWSEQYPPNRPSETLAKQLNCPEIMEKRKRK